MDQNTFEKEFHWLYGLDEYYEFTGNYERWEILRKALMQNNFYRIRDVIHTLLSESTVSQEHLEQHKEYLHSRGWLNVLLRSQMPDLEIKHQIVINLINRYMNLDGFTTGLARFINYWGGDGSESSVMPDLNDFLSRGQVKSKLWLITELAKIVEGPIGNVVFYGGWYNFSAFFLFDQFDVKNIYTIDLNEDVIEPSKVIYKKEVDDNRFHIITGDVGKITWQDNKFRIQDDHNGAVFNEEANVVINTSCEHMDNSWYENLPDGTFVVLHQNDYFSNDQHVNCCKDLDDVKQKYPMQNIFYEGELNTHLYNRFMLIGIK